MRADLLDAIDCRARDFKFYGRFEEALCARLTLEKAYERSGTERTFQAANLNWIACLAMQLNRRSTAERAARKCVEIYSPICTPNDEKLATYYSMLAAVLAESLKFEEAVDFYKKSIDIFENNHGSDSEFVRDRKSDLNDIRNHQIKYYIERHS